MQEVFTVRETANGTTGINYPVPDEEMNIET